MTAALVVPGCTKQQTQGASPAYLIVDALVAARGDEPDKDSGVLDSDVSVLVNGGSTVYPDFGKATLRLALKDPGSPTSPTQPTAMNHITVTRYHVKFTRSDGRNTQGVDVPYEFDGATTVTVGEGTSQAVFTLVRAQSKFEAPLMALKFLGGSVIISTIAEVTLYGTDQAGREVSVKALISVNFADFADPS